MNISGLGSTASITQNLQQAEVRMTPTIAPQGVPSASAAESDTVSISDDGQKKLSTELGAAMYKKTQNAANAKTQESEQADTRTDIEKKIDKLKEEIQELKQQRQALANDKSEAAEEKRKQIDSEILMLVTQLTTLLEAQKDQAQPT